MPEIAILIIGILVVSAYMLPTVVGTTRKVVNVGSIFAINLLLGWTLIGWVVALAMAMRTNPPYAYPQYWQGTQPIQPAPAPAIPAGWYPDPGGVTRWWDGAQWTTNVHPDQAISSLGQPG